MSKMDTWPVEHAHALIRPLTGATPADLKKARRLKPSLCGKCRHVYMLSPTAKRATANRRQASPWLAAARPGKGR